MSPPIRFYLPKQITADISTAWDVYQLAVQRRVRPGVAAWTIQTFVHLRAAGYPCELTHVIPTDGILIAHRKSVPPGFIPPQGVLFVCLRADATFHPYAHWHVVQNRRAVSPWFPSIYLPHWPQPGLIPRDPARGDTWENAAYLGDPGCITREMQGASWDETLRALGLQWRFVGPEKWHDFRDIDVVVAVRGFDRHRHTNKPPTKLFNAWHAGVPAVLGRESGYQQERQDPQDYLEVSSFSEVVTALRRLQEEPALRHVMSAHGFKRAQESSAEAITARWQDFLEQTARPAYEQLQRASGRERSLFLASGKLKAAVQHIRERLGK